MPKVPRKVVPTFSDKEIEKLLAQPDKQTDRGYRDYALLPTFVDTGARLSEIANLRIDDVDLEQGYLKAMGNGSKISRAESCISILKTRTKVSLIYWTSTLC